MGKTAPHRTNILRGDRRDKHPEKKNLEKKRAQTTLVETYTSLPPALDVAALAQLYNSPPVSHFDHMELLEQARRSLAKYELAENELAIASESLANSMHLLLEQHGLHTLSPEHMAALEKDVLRWCGTLRPQEKAEE